MSSSSPPFRIDNDIYQAAKAAAARMHRSAAQQLAYWARLGRELEASDSLSHRDISAVLAGREPYDLLDAKEQAVVRTVWSDQIDDAIDQLDLSEHFARRGESFVDMNEAGRLVRHHSDGSVEVLADAEPRD